MHVREVCKYCYDAFEALYTVYTCMNHCAVISKQLTHLKYVAVCCGGGRHPCYVNQSLSSVCLVCGYTAGKDYVIMNIISYAITHISWCHIYSMIVTHTCTLPHTVHKKTLTYHYIQSTRYKKLFTLLNCTLHCNLISSSVLPEKLLNKSY